MLNFKRKIKYFYNKLHNPSKGFTSEEYWTQHMVSNEDWLSKHQSLEYFHWRNQQYPGYIDLMPVNCGDDLAVMDYGCGPGNDLVGFSEFSKPSKLIGADVSPTALKKSKERLSLHNNEVELLQLNENDNKINLPDGMLDLVHSSGVLHHIKNLDTALNEINRVMKLGAKFHVMVYNYNSLWLHLYTAYIHQIERRLYSDETVLDAFSHLTDGPNCPISHCYRPQEFLDLVCGYGFDGKFKGSSISLTELTLLHKRFYAIKNRKLHFEHRNFLSKLTFNEHGHPLHEDNVAGINACFEFTKID
jgi:hypothetical protein